MPVLKRIVLQFAGMLLLAGTVFFISAQAPSTREYQVKAVFLFNFTQFVEWPAAAFSSEQAPLVIGILGKDPFGSFLDETVSGEKINNHPIIIQRYSNIAEIKECHILFLNPESTSTLTELLVKLQGKPVLTVSDNSSFIKAGGMIRFIVNRDSKIEIQINPEPAKAEGLVISSKLLRTSEIITPKK